MVATLCLVGCPAQQKRRALETRLQALVARKAADEQIRAEFGTVQHVFTQQEVSGYLTKTRADDYSVRKVWGLLSQYPQTLYFETPEDHYQIYVCLDETRRAAAYYLDQQ